MAVKFTRKGSANWTGTGMEGSGTVSSQTGTLKNTPLTFKSRFEEGTGTNPEELVGAAHAGCFTMQLSFLISEAGHTPDNLDTEAHVSFEDGTITNITLDLKGKVPGISEQEFNDFATKAKEICPISKLMNTEITLNTTFEG